MENKRENLFTRLKNVFLKFLGGVRDLVLGISFTKEEKNTIKEETLKKIQYENKVTENKIQQLESALIKERIAEILKTCPTTEDKFKEFEKLAKEYNRPISINMKDGQSLYFVPRDIKDYGMVVDIGIQRNNEQKLTYIMKHISDGKNNVTAYNATDLKRGEKIAENLRKREVERMDEQQKLKKLKGKEKRNFLKEIKENEKKYNDIQNDLINNVQSKTMKDIADDFDKSYELGSKYSIDFQLFMEKEASFLDDKKVIDFGIPSKSGLEYAVMSLNKDKVPIISFFENNEKITLPVNKDNMQKIYDYFKNSGCVSPLDIKTHCNNMNKTLDSYRKEALEKVGTTIQIPVHKSSVTITASLETYPHNFNQLKNYAENQQGKNVVNLASTMEIKGHGPANKIMFTPDGVFCNVPGTKEYRQIKDETIVKALFDEGKIKTAKFEYSVNGNTSPNAINDIKDLIKEYGMNDDSKLFSQRERNEIAYDKTAKQDNSLEADIEKARKESQKEIQSKDNPKEQDREPR